MNDLVSVLIPVYNHERYIVECLNSVKTQTYNNIELIIINDGSIDGSDSEIKKWILVNSKFNVKYFIQNNIGITKTLNKMISISKGKYITICASDDVLTEDSIDSRINFLKKNSKFDACIGDAEVIGSNSEFVCKSAMKNLYQASYKKLENDIVTELVLNWSVVGPTFLAKKELFKKIGTYDESLLVEDREFYLRLLSNHMLIFIPKTIAKYRIHNNNSSRKNKKSKWVVYNQIAKSNLKHADKFKGICKYFLNSHHVDLFFTSFKYNLFFYCIFNNFRIIRKGIIKMHMVNK